MLLRNVGSLTSPCLSSYSRMSNLSCTALKVASSLSIWDVFEAVESSESPRRVCAELYRYPSWSTWFASGILRSESVRRWSSCSFSSFSRLRPWAFSSISIFVLLWCLSASWIASWSSPFLSAPFTSSTDLRWLFCETSGFIGLDRCVDPSLFYISWASTANIYSSRSFPWGTIGESCETKLQSWSSSSTLTPLWIRPRGSREASGRAISSALLLSPGIWLSMWLMRISYSRTLSFNFVFSVLS